jgi:hypothetical protein
MADTFTCRRGFSAWPTTRPAPRGLMTRPCTAATRCSSCHPPVLAASTAVTASARTQLRNAASPRCALRSAALPFSRALASADWDFAVPSIVCSSRVRPIFDT